MVVPAARGTVLSLVWPTDLRVAFSEALHRELNGSGLPPELQERLEAILKAPGGVLDASSTSRLPLLAVLSYESAGGDQPRVQARLGAAMGFILAAADVLDDLQDGDTPCDGATGAAECVVALLLLGHRSLAHAAVASGDESAGSRALRAQLAMDELCLASLGGQHAEIKYSSRPAVNVKQALGVTALKSGSLARCAAMVGASFATDDIDEIELHGEFGMSVGIVAQLINDVDGVRPHGAASTDLALGRKTLPIAYVLEVPEGVNDAADWAKRAIEDRSAVSGRDAFSPEDEGILREALYDSGAVHYSWVVAAAHHAQAASIYERICDRRPASRINMLL